MKTHTYTFNYPGKTIPVILGYNILPDITAYVDELNPDNILIITDSVVEELYVKQVLEIFKNYPTHSISFKHGEKRKNISTLEKLLEESENYTTRDSCIVTLGGGVTGNIGGLVASMLYRGIPFFHIPTTVISQLDSSISAKQAINSRNGKNTFGSYYPPEFVYIDTAFLETLDNRNFRSGLAEAVKHAISQSSDFYTFLFDVLQETSFTTDQQFQMIQKTVELKLTCLEKDPTEGKTIPFLEFGHTIGHAIEKNMDGKWSHGESICIGMKIEAYLSYLLGELPESELDKILSILDALQLHQYIPKKITPKKILDAISHDHKQRRDGHVWMLPTKVGELTMIHG